LTAVFAAEDGMACHSLRHDGEELLGAVRLEGLAGVPWTSGIPLLHPWANRLGGFRYDGVTLDPDSPELYLEEHGLPLHGLRGAVTGWEVREAGERRLVAGRAFAGVAEFPFDHRVEIAAELSDSTLALTTTLTATGSRPVPVAFGHHPYLRLPGVPRAEWEITLPVADRVAVDARLVPTGELEPAGDLNGPLGTRTFDDGFTLAADAGPFVLAGGGWRIEVAFESGYPYAQIFAPEISDVICFEPMTAPADALRHSPGSVAPGDAYSARFSVSVARTADVQYLPR
jgi:galactose mutarotase-like enzyme